MQNFRLTAAVFLTGCSMSSMAYAQDKASSDAGVEDIIVTAQRREERLQDVPIAITAVTAAQMSRVRTQTTYDVVKLTPALTVTRTTGYAIPFLRGIGSPNFNPGDEPSVATYVDGFYQGPTISSALPFNGIERIEVLKGPQGTLYGRNATGGLINVITLTPGDALAANGSASYANYNTIEARSYVGGPLSSGLKADIAVNYRNQGKGYARNLFTGHRVAEDDQFGIRSKLVADVTETAQITLTGEYSFIRNNIGATSTNYPGTVPGPASLGGRYSNTPFQTYNNMDPVFNTRVYGATGKIKIEAGGVNLISMSQFKKYSYFQAIDGDGTSLDGVPGTPQTGSFGFKTTGKMPYFLTQEFQVVSNTQSSLSWILGLFGISDKETWEPNATGITAAGPYTANLYPISKTQAAAGYAQATYKLDNGLSLTGGVRYNIETKKFHGDTLSATGVPLVPTVDKQKTFRSFTFRASADYRISQELLVYASASKGFKSGVYNASAINTSAAVKPETLYAYEVGFKADPSRLIRFNGAFYYYDYRDIQFFSQSPAGLGQLQNATSAKLYGADLDLELRPMAGLMIRSGVGIEHARYNKWTDAQVYFPAPSGIGYVSVSQNVSGNQVVRTPKLTGNLGVFYDIALDNDGKISLAANGYYNSGYPFDPNGNQRQKAFATLDSSIGYTLPGGHLEVSVWAKNLTNKLFLEGVTAGSRNIRANYGAPRTYGVAAGFKF